MLFSAMGPFAALVTSGFLGFLVQSSYSAHLAKLVSFSFLSDLMGDQWSSLCLHCRKSSKPLDVVAIDIVHTLPNWCRSVSCQI